MSPKGHSPPHLSAALAAGLALCAFLAAGVPTLHRANSQVLVRSDAVLAYAARCNAKHILLATNSPTLNAALMRLTIKVSDRDVSVVVDAPMGWGTGAPIEEEFRSMRESDLVFFQERDALAYTVNPRVSEYERYLRQGGYVPIHIDGDVSVYSIQCRP